MIPGLALVPGDTLGKKLYNVAIALVVVGIVGWLAYQSLRGDFWKWRATRNDKRADVAEANVRVATRNAQQANGAATNATETRAAMDAATTSTRTNTAEAVRRITNAPAAPVSVSGALSVDLVRELDAARDRAGTAADRLQRTRAR
jgi:Tfp pilus assembly protein PilE